MGIDKCWVLRKSVQSLLNADNRVSKEYVAKLMCEMGLSSIRTTAKKDLLKLHEPEEDD